MRLIDALPLPLPLQVRMPLSRDCKIGSGWESTVLQWICEVRVLFLEKPESQFQCGDH
jgi:hypothetical protein